MDITQSHPISIKETENIYDVKQITFICIGDRINLQSKELFITRYILQWNEKDRMRDLDNFRDELY